MRWLSLSRRRSYEMRQYPGCHRGARLAGILIDVERFDWRGSGSKVLVAGGVSCVGGALAPFAPLMVMVSVVFTSAIRRLRPRWRPGER